MQIKAWNHDPMLSLVLENVSFEKRKIDILDPKYIFLCAEQVELPPLTHISPNDIT